MIKKIILLCFFLPHFVSSQEKLNDLSSPTSPASSILGVQPKTILSPKSYQALETALYSNFTNNNTAVIPNEFALEFTPYWTKNHGLSLEDYLFPSFVDQIWRTSSFSVASTQDFVLESGTPSNSISLGYRTTLYFSSEADKKKIGEFRDKIDNRGLIVGRIGAKAEGEFNQKTIADRSDFIQKFKGAVTDLVYELGGFKNMEDAEEVVEKIFVRTLNEATLDVDNHDAFLDKFYIIVDEELKTHIVFEEFKQYISERQGLSVDIAYASLVNFPTNKFEYSFVPRQSFWLTPAYNFMGNADFLSVLGVVRYEWYNMNYFKEFFQSRELFENNLDYGLGVSAKFKRFSLQLEAVGRSSQTEIPAGTDLNGNNLYLKKESSDFQYVGTFSYNLTDQIILTYNLGKSFEPIQNPEQTLISLLSLNFGFGAPTTNDLTTN